MESFEKEQPVDLKKYLHVLKKRRWTIIMVFALVLLIAFALNYLQNQRFVPMYQGTSRIIIERRSQTMLPIQEAYQYDVRSWEELETQLEVIQSRAVAKSVIRSLDLENNPDFFPKPPKDVLTDLQNWGWDQWEMGKEWFFSLIDTRGGGQARAEKKVQLAVAVPEVAEVADGPDEPSDWFIRSFLRRISVERVGRTRLVDIHFNAPDPALAAKIVNEIVDTYIDLDLERKLTATKEAAQWLAERVSEERKKVEEAEVALLQYKDKQDILSELSSSTDNINARKLAELNAQVVDMEARRVEAETRYRQALAVADNPDQFDSITEVLNNKLIQDLKRIEVDLYNRLSELSKKYGENHPKKIAVQTELDALRERKANEIQGIINSLRNDYRLALAKERSLKQTLEEEKDKVRDLNRKAIQYRVLQRQAESSKHMYDLLIKRLKETSLTEEMKTQNIRIIDSAEINRGPINRTSPGSRIKKALLIGLALGLGLAFLLEYLDNTIKLPTEIDEYLKIPHLGLVPAYSSAPEVDGIKGDLITAHSPKAVASESYRGIRTGILFSSVDINPQVILVTSAGPKEGKTSTAANLAVTMAQAGSPTLLMDCDMRRPRLHTIFDADRSQGISTILAGADPTESVITSASIEHLSILPSGPIPPNPSEILGSKKMAALIGELRKSYSRIIIDTPPITSVTDAVVLSKSVDGVVLVIRAGETPRQLVENSLNKLRMVNANILGAILNGVDARKDSYYYYQYQYYYYYGEDGGKKRRKERGSKKPPSDKV